MPIATRQPGNQVEGEICGTNPLDNFDSVNLQIPQTALINFLEETFEDT